MGCPRILIIDDEPSSALLLESCLSSEGFSAFCADTGPAGRDLAHSRRPDLILLDRNMPGEDGLETCHKLKDNPVTAHIPIIFVSSDEDTSVKVTAFDAGAVDYITKPFARAEVLARVRLHLRLHRAQRETIEAQAEKLHHLAQAQQAMLVQPDQCPQARFSVFWQPLEEAGGDFYDVVPVAEGIWDYLVADVAGHDLAASLTTAALKALLRQNVSPLCDPRATLQTINSVMNRVYPEGPFVSLAYARLNRLRNSVAIVIAGHPPVIKLDADGVTRLVAEPSDLIGAFDPATLYYVELPAKRGDRLHLYTDGLIETGETGPITRPAGLARLAALCTEHRSTPLESVSTTISRQIIPATRTAPDDVLLLTVEV